MIFFNTKTCCICGHQFKASTGKKIKEVEDLLMMGCFTYTRWFCKEHAPKYDYIENHRFYRNDVHVGPNGGFEH